MIQETQRVVFTGPEQASIEMVAFDPFLELDMVLFRNQWSLISPGTELAVYTNRIDLGDRRDDPFPAYPGYAAVGIIEAVGSVIESLSPGDRVLAISGHCSYAKFKPVNTFFLKLPDDISGKHATFIRMALITQATLCKADLRAGEWLGIVGLGLVGNLGAQIGRCAGFNVITVGRSPLRSELAARCGIEHILSGSPEEVSEQVRFITGGLGCRLVLDTSGTTKGLLKAIALAGDGGTISLVGVPWVSDPSVHATEIMQPLFSRYLKIQGGWEWDLPLFEKDSDRSLPMLRNRYSVESNAKYTLQLIRKDAIQIDPLITHRIPPIAIQETYQGLLHKRNEYLGVIIDWREDQ
jgi:threonine dehydrogenase-like Zn-dependent dehydrogenase